jgi:hypothetical protein
MNKFNYLINTLTLPQLGLSIFDMTHKPDTTLNG